MTTTETSPAAIDPVELAKARKLGINARGRKKFYDRTFDLSGIPEYRPRRTVTGTVRQWGNHYFALSGLMDVWEEGFRRYHPDATFADNLASSAVAFPGLIAGNADIAPIGREALWTELKGAERQDEHEGGQGRLPLEITVCTGSYNVSGWTFAFAVFVNKQNPIQSLTLEQLDGIFGAERNGGWNGLSWDTSEEMVRGPEKNIRTWGQLGLTGEWADQPIRVHAYNLSFHFPDEFDKKVLKNSQKWNESMTTYANMFGLKADGTMTVAGEQMVAAVDADPYAITYTGILYQTENIKAVPLAPKAGAPAVPISLETVQDRTYPLTRNIYYYTAITSENRVARVHPDGAEFLRYLLSREAQQAIQEHDCKYLPLTADEARRQLQKLEEYLD